MEGPAYEGELIELPVRGCDDLGVVMAEVDRRIGGQTVQIPPAFDIGDPRTTSTRRAGRMAEVIPGGCPPPARPSPRCR